MQSIKINKFSLIKISITISLLLSCFTVTQCIPEILRRILQILSIALFLTGIFAMNARDAVRYVVLVVFFSCFVYGVWKYSNSLFSCIYNVIIGFSFAYFGIYTLKCKDTNKINFMKICNFVSVLFVITAITTIIGLHQYPLAVRELGRSTFGYNTSGAEFIALKETYKRHNIATWSIINGMSFIVPNLVFLWKKMKSIKYLLFAIICEICILYAQLTFAFLFSILFSTIILFDFYSEKKLQIAIVLMIPILCILFVFLDQIFIEIIKFLDDRSLSMISRKLESLLMLINGVVSGDASDRFLAYQQSLNLFFKYPLFGLSVMNVNKGTFHTFGQHSDFFDLLGYYGLFGIIFCSCVIYKYYKWVKNIWHKEYKFIIIMLLGLILFMVVNPVWYSPQLYIGCILIPCLITAFMKERERDLE